MRWTMLAQIRTQKLGMKGGLHIMQEWYKEQIAKMLAMIEDEEYLKKLYIIINNHMKKED